METCGVFAPWSKSIMGYDTLHRRLWTSTIIQSYGMVYSRDRVEHRDIIGCMARAGCERIRTNEPMGHPKAVLERPYQGKPEPCRPGLDRECWRPRLPRMWLKGNEKPLLFILSPKRPWWLKHYEDTLSGYEIQVLPDPVSVLDYVYSRIDGWLEDEGLAPSHIHVLFAKDVEGCNYRYHAWHFHYEALGMTWSVLKLGRSGLGYCWRYAPRIYVHDDVDKAVVVVKEIMDARPKPWKTGAILVDGWYPYWGEPL